MLVVADRGESGTRRKASGNAHSAKKRSSGTSASSTADAIRSAAGDTEVKIAAAAFTAALSPPLGIAVAAGAALRSPRVRDALRRGTVQALAGAMRVTDQITGEHAREDSRRSE